MSGVVDRLRSPERWLLGLGPLALCALFLVRATTPTPDVVLLSIFVVLVAATGALIAGSRVGGGVVTVLALALFQPMTAREFAFSLTSIDSAAWRWWAVASVVAIGWSLVAGAVVLVRGERIGEQRLWLLGAQIGAGLVLGVALLAVFPALAPQPAFGQGLGDDDVDELPVIELLDYRYEPIVVQADSGNVYRAKLDNPSDAAHTFTIESIDLEVYVPAGRWAILELDVDDLAGAPLAVICTIGDHLALGMAGSVETR